MMLYAGTIFLATISSTIAWTIHQTKPPVVIGCSQEVLNNCPKLPPYMYCAKWYVPEGHCCPVCACKDEHGEAFAASSIFLTHKESDCRRCNCKDQGGILTAKCFKVHCPHLNCPLPFQEKSENGCCKTCSSGWAKPVRTFPPFPGGGFPKPGGGFPKPGGGFPKPGGGFPPFGDAKADDLAGENSSKKKLE